MCGRYAFFDEQEVYEARKILEDIAATFGKETADKIKTGEIFPTYLAPVVGLDGPEIIRWGFPMQGKSQTIINARSETAYERPMFRSALTARRVVIPTTGFYEWSHENGKSKDKFLFRVPGEKVLYLAGMFTDFNLPTGREKRFTILTTAANESMKPYHDRMPVYIAANERNAWVNDPASVEEILNRQQPSLYAEKVTKGGQTSFL
jgi:putative SOS response-associated peptidase YedK